MDFLISTGTFAAYIYALACLIVNCAAGRHDSNSVNFFQTSAVLITVVLIGKYLESYTRSITARAIFQLSNLRAQTARLVRGSDEVLFTTTTATRPTGDGTVNNSHTNANQTLRKPVNEVATIRDDAEISLNRRINNSGTMSCSYATSSELDSNHVDTGTNNSLICSGSRQQPECEDSIRACAPKSESESESEKVRRSSEGANTMISIKSTGRSTKGTSAAPTGDRLIDASLVQKGDILRLVGGESVPADGVLQSNTLGVDESMMTVSEEFSYYITFE
jgi:magnesium-transporting ATPase (P-type)